MHPRDALWLGRFRLKCFLKRVSKALRVRSGFGRNAEWLRPAPLPRTIWTYWHQGWDDAPELVLACLRSWEVANPGWRVMPLSQADYRAYAEVPFRDGMSVNHFSDLLRLALLARHGGVWADATCHCATPLEGWLPPLMQSGFFAFARPAPDRMVASWFLAACPGNRLAARWYDEALRYWRLTRRADHYFYVHFLFEQLQRRDRAVRRVWAATPKLKADPAHVAQAYLEGELDRAFLAGVVASGAAPVHKLSWKLEGPPDRLQTVQEMIPGAYGRARTGIHAGG